MSDLRHINENEFESVIKENKLVLVDFFATWCPPCKMLSPVLEKVQDEFKEDLLIVKIDVDQNEVISRQFRVMSIPTLVIFKDGVEKQTEIGFKDFGSIVEMIKKYID